LKILIVDDDRHIVELLPLILENEGFCDVSCHTSPKAAFAALLSATEAFDCLILDIDMPDINGIEFCKQARNIPAYREIPIVMLTGRRDEETMREALMAGATDYVTKPFDVLQIGVRIRLSAKLVRANRAMNSLRRAQEIEPVIPLGKPHGLTREEVMNIFADELYPPKKG